MEEDFSGKLIVAGKRKKAVAKATISAGKGKILINQMPYENLPFFKKLMVQEALDIAKKVLGEPTYNIQVKMSGGGQESQIDAARLSIAKAIVAFTKSAELKKAYLSYDRSLLVADIRRKEPYKPGDSKARAKRQKSYR